VTDDLWDDEHAERLAGQHRKSKAPVAKVTAAGLAGSLTILLVWIAGLFDLDVPAEVASSFTALAAAGAGYIKKG
jgi:hypothetical protein